MEKHRCGWCVGDPLYEAYHDHEWGVPFMMMIPCSSSLF